MKVALDYDDAYDPPAPVVPVTVGIGERVVLLPMFLDTGADFTLIPEDVAATLALPPMGRTEVRGVTGEPVVRGRYAAVLAFGGWARTMPVVAVGDVAILGRDVLAWWVAALDGPRGHLELTRPGRARRPARRKR